MTSIDTTHERLAALLAHREHYGVTAETPDAILAEFVVIPRSELPEATEDEDALRVGPFHLSNTRIAAEMRTSALRFLALAEHLERREATDAKRNARRDEVATEVADKVYGPAPFPTTYAGATSFSRPTSTGSSSSKRPPRERPPSRLA
jgi:hypothetical protein